MTESHKPGPDARDLDARFRITTWPEHPLTPLPAERSSALLWTDELIQQAGLDLEGGWLSWFPDPGKAAEISPELIFRDLQDIDLAEDVPGVLRFVQTHGAIRRRFDLFNWPPPALPTEPMPRRVWNHILDVALYLRTMRAMTNHWLNYLENKEVADAWHAESTPGSVLNPRYPSRSWEMFAEGMSAGLNEYKVRVEYRIPFADGRGFTLHQPRPDLFSAMCLQLFNVMTEDLPVRHCDKCGRRFFRQIGRAQYEQYRTKGVRFCSRSCARAHAQQEYRRRKKEKK